MKSLSGVLNISYIKQYFLMVLSIVLYPLGPKCDENEISLYVITTCSNIQVMRIKDMITNYKRCNDISTNSPY